jgi:hypothetical protein
MATGHTLSSFFIVNRDTDNEELDAAKLAKLLNDAMGDQARKPDPTIILRYGGYDGRFLHARADDQFNGDKGKLDVSFNDDTIDITIKSIKSAAVLKVDI